MPEFLGNFFEGPYEVGKKLIDRAAVYVILDARDDVVDVGQSGETGTRLSNHERKSCWDRYGGKWFAVKWMPSSTFSKEDRETMETAIRNYYKPPCGKK